MNFQTLDLNLLRILDALLHEGSTVRAARRLGLSQPAVSAALGRLRLALDDPLFVRQGQSLTPTDFGRSLEVPLRETLEGLEALLSRGRNFDPATSEARFVMSGSDFFAELMLPALARVLTAEAPGMRLSLIELAPEDYLAHLQEGRADLALVPAHDLQDWAVRRPLFLSDFSVIARKGHPRIAAAGIRPGQTLPLDLFCDIGQVLFSLEGRLATLGDAALRKIGRTRRVVMTAADFSGVYRTVAETDLISLIPSELALRVAAQTGLELFTPPVQVGPVPIALAWHPRSSANPAHRWLRERIAALSRGLQGVPPLQATPERAIP